MITTSEMVHTAGKLYVKAQVIPICLKFYFKGFLCWKTSLHSQKCKALATPPFTEPPLFLICARETINLRYTQPLTAGIQTQFLGTIHLQEELNVALFHIKDLSSRQREVQKRIELLQSENTRDIISVPHRYRTAETGPIMSCTCTASATKLDLMHFFSISQIFASYLYQQSANPLLSFLNKYLLAQLQKR